LGVPTATVVRIEKAGRCGISQLRRLRGRVGRGEHASVCLLVGPPSLRLRALAEHSDGFRLAEIDLALRREGELVGTRQSGFGQFRVASLPDDAPLLERARTWAEAIIGADPALRAPEHALLAHELLLRFGGEARFHRARPARAARAEGERSLTGPRRGAGIGPRRRRAGTAPHRTRARGDIRSRLHRSSLQPRERPGARALAALGPAA